jgi:hypothetical protein
MKLLECPYCHKVADTAPYIYGWVLGHFYEEKSCQHCSKSIKINRITIGVLFPLFAVISLAIFASGLIAVAKTIKSTLNIDAGYVFIGYLILMFPVGLPIGVFYVNYVLPFIMGNIFRIRLFKK